MKSIVYSLLFITLLSCDNKQKEGSQSPLSRADLLSEKYKPTKDKFPVMEFEKAVVKIANPINEGDSLVQHFKFKNTGNLPLVVNYCSASCGCTVPTWPQYPIQPGDTAAIVTVFHSKNREGINHKTITVYANTIPETSTVSFEVEVKKVPVK